MCKIKILRQGHVRNGGGGALTYGSDGYVRTRPPKKGRHCCSVGELKITFASTCNHGCKESVFNVLFNVLFLVLDFPLGAPNTLLKHVIERSIWRIVVGEGSWWGWGFSQDW